MKIARDNTYHLNPEEYDRAMALLYAMRSIAIYYQNRNKRRSRKRGGPQLLQKDQVALRKYYNPPTNCWTPRA